MTCSASEFKMERKNKKIRAVLFDVGNTLLFPDYPFIRKLLSEYQIEVSVATLKALDFEAKVKTQNLQAHQPWKHYFTVWLTSAGVQDRDLPELFRKLWQRHRHKNLWSLVDQEVYPTLKELKNREYRLGVISNSDGKIKRLLNEAGLLTYFDTVADSGLVGARKPDPIIFEGAVRELKMNPEEALFVGDSYEMDVVGALNAGLSALLFDPLNKGSELGCSRIGRLSDLLNIV